MYKIDETNVEIINLLMGDGRMSCAEIAQRLGDVSERSVRYRIDRMLQEDIIQICAVPSPEKLGFPVIADVFITVESAHILDVAQKLAAYECTSYVGCAIGEPDVSVQIFAPDNASVYEFITTVIAKMEGVSHTRTAILPHILKDVHQWRVPRSLGAGRIDSKGADKPIRGGE
jgi:Lrp/AsnC family transcriptional regulator for asnA, asnC and gidA